MRRSVRGALAAVAVTAAAGVLTMTGPVSAGDVPTQVYVHLDVYAPGASAVLDELTVEIWDIAVDPEVPAPGASCDDPAGMGALALADSDDVQCGVPASGDYALGLDGLPTGATADADCFTNQFPSDRIESTSAEFTIDQGVSSVDCYVTVVLPAVIIDKIVGSGDATPSDFTMEVYDDVGTKVGEDVDPTTGFCGEFSETLDDCAVIALPEGAYQIGEIAAPGYVPTNVWCTTFTPPISQPEEAFPAGIGEFELGNPDDEDDPFAHCIVTNDFYEGDLIVEKVVVNDDGGTATADQFTAEIYREADGTMVTSQQCAANGDCLSETLPIGEYRIGESGPSGYTPTVVCTETSEPTPLPGISTVPPLVEAIPGAEALATVERDGEVTCVITNDDPTTTTTTMLATTTTDLGGQPVVPTTLAPILPATGPNDSNGTMAVIALVLLAVGGSLLALRRRPA
jgi:LPXTG-motif cell wall-anchored protein